MKLLLLSHSASPYGAERVLIALALGLQERGHDVTLAFPHQGPAVDAARDRGVADIRVTGRHRLPRNAGEAARFLSTAPAAVARTRRTARTVAPDVVWINSVYNPWAAIGARLFGAPVVWHLHEYPLPEPGGVGSAALIGATATRVAAISGFVARGWRRYPWLRHRISVLQNPLLTEVRPVRTTEAGPFTVGYIGQLEPRKRVPDLVRAIARLPEDVHGVIVGDGKDRSATEAVIRDGRAAHRIELAGFQPDINTQLGRLRCLAIPSLREPFGLVALEAMAAGLPVIAARSGALPDVLGDAALYHDPGDPSDLADQIRKLKADPVLQQTLAERGLARVKGFRTDLWLDRAEAIARAAAGRDENA